MLPLAAVGIGMERLANAPSPHRWQAHPSLKQQSRLAKEFRIIQREN
jgi:hypothetical protein